MLANGQGEGLAAAALPASPQAAPLGRRRVAIRQIHPTLAG